MLEIFPYKGSDCVGNIEDKMLDIEVIAEVRNGDDEEEQDKILKGKVLS